MTSKYVPGTIRQTERYAIPEDDVKEFLLGIAGPLSKAEIISVDTMLLAHDRKVIVFELRTTVKDDLPPF